MQTLREFIKIRGEDTTKINVGARVVEFLLERLKKSLFD